MKTPAHIRLPVKTDNYGQYIFDARGNMILEIRGWGWLSNLLGPDAAADAQIEIAAFVVSVMNKQMPEPMKKA